MSVVCKEFFSTHFALFVLYNFVVYFQNQNKTKQQDVYLVLFFKTIVGIVNSDENGWYDNIIYLMINKQYMYIQYLVNTRNKKLKKLHKYQKKKTFY